MQSCPAFSWLTRLTKGNSIFRTFWQAVIKTDPTDLSTPTSRSYTQRGCLSLRGAAHSLCSPQLRLNLVFAARFEMIPTVLTCTGPVWVGAVKQGVLISGCFLTLPEKGNFSSKHYFNQSYMGPNFLQSITNSVYPWAAHPLLSLLDDCASSLAQASSETEGELFHSCQKEKYKQTTTCYIKLWEEKSILGKYQATYFMILKCHSFVQYWLVLYGSWIIDLRALGSPWHPCFDTTGQGKNWSPSN